MKSNSDLVPEMSFITTYFTLRDMVGPEKISSIQLETGVTRSVCSSRRAYMKLLQIHRLDEERNGHMHIKSLKLKVL